MWPSWEHERVRLSTLLTQHSNNIRQLPGIATPAALATLSLQFVASLRRERYYVLAQRRAISARRANPNDPQFDAEKAVAYHTQERDIDEASWLVFLMTHFGRPADSGWRRLKDVYGMLGKGVWDWKRVRENPSAFTDWLAKNSNRIRGKFGNHRKYETLRSDSDRGTGKVIESYIRWVGPADHRTKFANVVRAVGNDPHAIFDALYHDLNVKSFGRLAKFDYLSLIGRYALAPIDAGSAYLNGATGPTRGARLLFDGQPDGASSPDQLQAMLDALDQDLQVTMKVMEDALCNWQKNPTVFVHFKG